jgi:predicted GNAT family N-acyltransferase
LKHIFILLIGAFISLVASANPNGISLHLECKKTQSACQEYFFLTEPNKSMMLQIRPSMVVIEQITESIKIKGEDKNNSSFLHIKIKEKYGKTFEEITANNIGTRLAVIVNGKVLMSPMIQDQIRGGHLMISASGVGAKAYTDPLPWISKMAKISKDSETEDGNSPFMLLIIAGVFFGGAILTNIIRRKKS